MKKEFYELAKEFDSLADEVIAEHEELAYIKENEIRIGFIKSSKKKKGARGHIIFADTRKVQEPYDIFCPFDFLITFYMPWVELMDYEQIKILMWHELKHCGMDFGGDFYLVPHDIEDFEDILQKHGLKWADVEIDE